MMDEPNRKGEFGVGFIHSLASSAGVYFQPPPNLDHDSIDVTLRWKGALGDVESPLVDAQIKCTSNIQEDGNELVYALKTKNYNDLVKTNLAAPKVLIVVHVPGESDTWLDHQDNHVRVFHAAYWVSLMGNKPTENGESKTIRIPKSNELTRDSILDLFEVRL